MKKNYWPHFIIGLVIFAISLGVWTVKTAIDNPVEIDDSYMMSYQELDKNIYKIEKMKKEFDKKYDVKFLTSKLNYPKSEIMFVILDKNGHPVTNADVDVLITRPETNKLDIQKKAQFKDNKYIVDVTLPKEGRWNVLLKIKVGDIVAYEKYKLSTRRIVDKNLRIAKIKQ